MVMYPKATSGPRRRESVLPGQAAAALINATRSDDSVCLT
jgi:hypothetical protein